MELSTNQASKQIKAMTFANRVIRSLSGAGVAVTCRPNRLLNLTLTGPFGGYFYTLDASTPYDTVAGMMRDAGYALDRRTATWKQRGQQSFQLQRSSQGCTLFV